MADFHIGQGHQGIGRCLDRQGSAPREQSAGINQVNDAVTQMGEVTQQNAALVEEAAGEADRQP
ncbi:hypothetical protein F2P45_28275 [Massilia sp. CCM 8733]|uniref:Methyl-accepting chemotaxis protein n=1 Tax=Massilia mucilaginosa TaxID=2609282 RepID=A0ABX0P0Z1_9BURK|nr:hypothetical protein [Massilia mucilaginosa]